jgi:hypothetical protein
MFSIYILKTVVYYLVIKQLLTHKENHKMRKSTVKHDANRRIVRDEPKKTYELTTAVFMVTNAREYEDDDQSQTLCVMRYIRLDGGLSRGSSIGLLADQIAERYHVGTHQVAFKFWCDGSTANGGSPIVIVPDGLGAKLL